MGLGKRALKAASMAEAAEARKALVKGSGEVLRGSFREKQKKRILAGLRALGAPAASLAELLCRGRSML